MPTAARIGVVLQPWDAFLFMTGGGRLRPRGFALFPRLPRFCRPAGDDVPGSLESETGERLRIGANLIDSRRLNSATLAGRGSSTPQRRGLKEAPKDFPPTRQHLPVFSQGQPGDTTIPTQSIASEALATAAQLAASHAPAPPVAGISTDEVEYRTLRASRLVMRLPEDTVVLGTDARSAPVTSEVRESLARTLSPEVAAAALASPTHGVSTGQQQHVKDNLRMFAQAAVARPHAGSQYRTQVELRHPEPASDSAASTRTPGA